MKSIRPSAIISLPVLAAGRGLRMSRFSRAPKAVSRDMRMGIWSVRLKTQSHRGGGRGTWGQPLRSRGGCPHVPLPPPLCLCVLTANLVPDNLPALHHKLDALKLADVCERVA